MLLTDQDVPLETIGGETVRLMVREKREDKCGGGGGCCWGVEVIQIGIAWYRMER